MDQLSLTPAYCRRLNSELARSLMNCVASYVRSQAFPFPVAAKHREILSRSRSDRTHSTLWPSVRSRLSLIRPLGSDHRPVATDRLLDTRARAHAPKRRVA